MGTEPGAELDTAGSLVRPQAVLNASASRLTGRRTDGPSGRQTLLGLSQPPPHGRPGMLLASLPARPTRTQAQCGVVSRALPRSHAAGATALVPPGPVQPGPVQPCPVQPRPVQPRPVVRVGASAASSRLGLGPTPHWLATPPPPPPPPQQPSRRGPTYGTGSHCMSSWSLRVNASA